MNNMTCQKVDFSVNISLVYKIDESFARNLQNVLKVRTTTTKSVVWGVYKQAITII